jgi:hypothetical protein
MACCGRGREQAAGGLQPEMGARTTVEFEYTGAKGLTVSGPVTGNVYRFEELLSRVAVDARDVPAIALVPQLRRAFR